MVPVALGSHRGSRSPDWCCRTPGPSDGRVDSGAGGDFPPVAPASSQPCGETSTREPSNVWHHYGGTGQLVLDMEMLDNLIFSGGMFLGLHHSFKCRTIRSSGV